MYHKEARMMVMLTTVMLMMTTHITITFINITSICATVHLVTIFNTLADLLIIVILSVHM